MDSLKQLFLWKILPGQDRAQRNRKTYGELKADEVLNIGQIIGGSRGIKTMIWDTSSLDANEGIRFRGYNIPQLRELLPKPGWCPRTLAGRPLLADAGRWGSNRRTGKMAKCRVGQKGQCWWQCFQSDWCMSLDTHPMTQFTIAVMAMQHDNIFATKYDEGLNKDEYWDAMYEDSMNLIARLPIIASYIFRRVYKGGAPATYDAKDWAANYAAMLGLTVNADYRPNAVCTSSTGSRRRNASAHTVKLVGSTLVIHTCHCQRASMPLREDHCT